VLRGRLGELRGSELVDAVRNAPLLAKQTLRYVREHRVYNPPDAEVHLRVHCEQRPDGASSIALSDERDSLGLLRTRLDWRIDAEELRTMRAFVEVAGRALSGIAEVIPDAGLMHGDGAEFVARCSDGLHHMGGMRMSVSPAHGVVDTHCRVHGTRNLYTVSGAVFPTSGYSNPTHTVLALAVRLADHLGGALTRA
jgi:choline dehydrogenase-like flavoprotein